RTIKGITNKEAEYLKSRKIFKKTFIDFLRKLTLPEYNFISDGDQYILTFKGNWPEVTLWETISLSIVNRLYYRVLLKNMSKTQRQEVYTEGKKRLAEKIKILKKNPLIKFADFGTRRRFSRSWHEYVLTQLISEVPGNLLGTSNVCLAMKYGIEPVGTFAHEMFMVFSGIFKDDIKGSHNKVLQYWWSEYGFDLSIALTDTYTSDFFFGDMTYEQALDWKGLRQDSGDPIEFGEKAIKFYESHGIDPREKLIVFSDGLDIHAIQRLVSHFNGRIKMSFGWGTNLTNDLGLKALSLVTKAIESNGEGTVKLSDNLAKAIGSQENIEYYKKIYKAEIKYNKACVY
ncbi:MAG: nicotinate phosphoribosyltransferase, partial [Patescibacteria group bacterium]|nr:nicotinate phosphoribosyltransferase [Patescibacteria group bacterium]